MGSPQRESTYSNAYMQDHPDPDPSDILRHRMHGLLEDVKLTWEDERRDPEKALAGSLLREQFEEESGKSSGMKKQVRSFFSDVSGTSAELNYSN